ncbi:MAG: NfeD family protein [Candidatus Altiarchaeota archaeon]
MELLYIWVAIAVVLMIGELLSTTFYLAFISFGALVAALLAYLGASVAIQIFAACVISALSLLFARPLAEKFMGKSKGESGVYSYVGETAVVLEAIDGVEDTGRIRAQSQEWKAVTKGNETIAKGEKVKVVAVDGTKLIVEKIN